MQNYNKMKKKAFDCYIICETSLGVECAKELLKEGNKLLGIVSADLKNQQWATQHNIRYFSSVKEFKKNITTQSFDYLFSIVNNHILPQSLLQLPRYCSINYHDALLPKYAGIHATSWAILNNERIHGITWHIMNEVVDSGNILRQSNFNLDIGETALSLNLKCYSHALDAFKKLIKDLVVHGGSIATKSQDLKNRSYFSFYKKPPSFGFIRYEHSAKKTDQLYRALNFGNYPNTLSSFKILIGQNVYNPVNLETLDTKSQAIPGTIVNITDRSIQISTKTQDIRLSHFRTLTGDLCTIEYIIRNNSISIGHALTEPSKKLFKQLHNLSKDVALSESFWKKSLINMIPIQVPYINQSYNFTQLTQGKKQKSKLFLAGSNVFTNFNYLIEGKSVDTADIFIAAFLVYLNYLGNHYPFTVGFVNSFLHSLPKENKAFFATCVPLTCAISASLNAWKIIECVQNEVAKMEKNKGYLKDVVIRYPDLASNDLNFPIVITKGNIKKTINNLQDATILFNVDREDKTYTLYYKNNLNEAIKCFFENFLQHIEILFNQIIHYPQQPLEHFCILTPLEKQQVITQWNDTDQEYPDNKTIQELFVEQVERTPDNIAVVYEDIKLTYRELNNKANQLANHLRGSYKVEPDTLIALCLDRSEHMLIAILAALKAGGAYVPMDPSYPDERINYILADTQAKIVLSNEMHQERLVGLAETIAILAIDSADFQRQCSLVSTITPITTTVSTNLAYVIYTSGTTGNPKGVMIEHRGVVNTLVSLNETYDFIQGNKVTAFTSYVFDVSVSEFFTVLLRGGELNILSAEVRNNSLLISKYILDKGINYIYLPPVLIAMLPRILYQTLSGIIYAGEVCDQSTGIYWSNHYKLYNYYGPTEGTIYACGKQIIDGDTHSIGKPIANLKAYILNQNQQPLPIGAIGELYIGGVGLARGYLNRTELTAEKFITNPFQTKAERDNKTYGPLGRNAKLYKTGDLVRYLPDGNIEYIGRNDFQVKIRGHRIELGEIENALSSYDGIKQSVVLVREHTNTDSTTTGNKYLVGYYVAEHTIASQEILNYLQTKLPEYMVPSILVKIDKLPLTVNGKLDRKALPDPEFTNTDSYVAPRGELEQQVCQIWAEVLGLAADKISINDDFFRLGGDSIISIQLVSRLRQRIGLNLSIKDIFSHKTIAQLYDRVLSRAVDAKELTLVKTEQGLLSGVVPLLPIQDWFFIANLTKQDHWNQSFIVKTPALDIKRLKTSIEMLVAHHDCLRMRYKRVKKTKDITPNTKNHNHNNNYIQYYTTTAEPIGLQVLDISTLKEKEDSKDFNTNLQDILTNWQSSFSLEHGPLCNIGYIYGYADGSARIAFALHHLIIDAVSWRILTEDLSNIYQGMALSLKGSSYRQWVVAVQEYGKNRANTNEQDYWHNILSDYDHHNKLTTLVGNEETLNYIGFKLNQEQTRLLLQETNRAYNTNINDLLLTALAYALAEITNNNINHIVLEGHGREEIDHSLDTTRTVGWFTTMYPVRLEITADISTSLKRIKESLRQIPQKGIGYGAIVGYRTALPRISFNYLGQFNQAAQKQDQESWYITGEHSGISVHATNQDYNILNINGLIVDGCLQFSIGSKLDQDITNILGESFKDQLTQLIDHTLHQTRSYLTTSDVNNIISQEYLDKLQSSKEIEGVYLANSLQQGFIYHALNQGDIDDAYRVQLIWEYHTTIDLVALKEAWSNAQVKYPTLRLRLAWDEELVQVIDKIGTIDWRYIDLSNVNTPTRKAKIKVIQESDRSEIYQLEQGNLFRVYIIKQQADLYTCIFSNHHAILDGWSGPVLLNYIHDVYTKLLQQEQPLLSIDSSYEEAQKYLQEHTEDNRGYWDNYVSKIEEKVDISSLLSSDKGNVRISEYKNIKEATEATLTIKDKLYSHLKELGKKEGVTLNAILQYVWHKILSIYGNNSKTIVGTTVSGRNLPIDNIESSVGLYINTLPLIVDHAKEGSLIDQIKSIQSDINEINIRSDVSLAKLQSGVFLQGERLFDSLFIYENYPSPTSNDQQDHLRIVFKESVEKLDYPLGVIGYEDGNKLIFKLTYAGELFECEAILSLLKISRKLLEQIAEDPHNPVTQLKYLPIEEYNQIVHEWNNTYADYPRDKTIQELFVEQVERTPDNIAVVYEDIKLTYRELNNKANQLANHLRGSYKVEPDTLIALCLDRSEHMLIAIFAALKAGGAYVPMDPSYPDERINYILADTQAKIVLSNEMHQERLVGLAETIAILAIDSADFQRQCSLVSTITPITSTRSNNLAYVIYTSGTTGKPKGVMIEHKGVVNSSYAAIGHRSITMESKVLCTAAYVFDSSVLEIYPTFFIGASLFIVKDTVRKDIYSIHGYCVRNRVTNLFLTTKLAEEFLHLENDVKDIIGLTIAIGGEAVKMITSSKYKIINEYGPTENSVCSTKFEILECSETIYIGKPIANLKAYILNQNQQPLPIGAIGELYIGGVGLARGYLNRTELTAEKFITNPFQTKAERDNKTYGPLGRNAKLYKTGDLVRYLPDGNIEYIGRNDFQVKIRGHRIELGEIENALSSYDGIKQSVVLVREHTNTDSTTTGNKYLVGYYVAEHTIASQEILNYLQTKLPEYMVPSILVKIDKLPLTVNGKLDRKALPDPEFTNTDSYVAPRGELEQQVCQIWAEVLGLAADKISINDDFFRLGGDSIISIQLVSRLRQRIGLNLSIKDIFSHKTIAQLYDRVLSRAVDAKELTLVKTEQGLLSGVVPLLPIQDWFFIANLTKQDHWNQSFIVKTPALDIKRLKTSIEMLVAHHDCLRMRYKRVKKTKDITPNTKNHNHNNNYIQYYTTTAEPIGLQVLDISTLKEKEDSKDFNTNLQDILTNWQSSFSLEHGPLCNIGYIYGYADGSARIVFALHHLIIDAVSWRILTEDLSNIYQGMALSLKGSSYRQWVVAVQEYGKNRANTNEQDYWHNILSDYDHHNKLTTLVGNEETLNYIGFKLNQEQTRLLLQETNRAYNTNINDLLLTALAYALAEITNNNINHIVLEGHGREEIDHSLDTTRTVGWFTTMYPVRLEITADISTSLKRIKESLRQIPQKGIGYGAIVGYRTALPRISFNYLGQFNQAAQKQDQESWYITGEHSGISVHATNQDYNILNINGLIVDGCLQFSIGSKLDQDITNILGESFKDQLTQLIDHTLHQTRSYLTTSDVNNIISQEYLDKLQSSKEIEGVYLANSLQQGFIYHALNQGDIDDAYRVQLIWEYHTTIDLVALKEAWSNAQVKYPTLRLRLAWDEELVQVIDKIGTIDWRYIDLSNVNTPTRKAKIKVIQESDRSEIYQLEQGNLFRVYIIKQQADLYTCIFSNHHAILDGWSGPVLLNYIHDVYTKLLQQEQPLLSIDSSYEEAQKYLQEHTEDNRGYWDNYVSKIEEKVDISSLLSSDKGNVRISEYKNIKEATEATLTIKDKLYSHLKELGKKEGVTLNAILQYVWHKILSIYGNNSKTIVGTTVSGRNLPIDNIESSVGLYINTLPLIVDHAKEGSLIDQIKSIQSDINEINIRSDVSLAKLQSGVFLQGERLFDSLFIYENYPSPTSNDQQDHLRIVFKESVEKLDYPLGVIGYEDGNKLIFKLTYAGELFECEAILSLLKISRKLLEQIAEDPHNPVTQLKYLPIEEYNQIVHEWNNTYADYPRDKTIQELFVEQVERTPDNIAVVYEDIKLTYRELNNKANQLANHLRGSYKVEPDTLIALCLDRSEHMLIAIFAALKAGGAYVPMDSSYPDERIKYVLEDMKAGIVLINKEHKERLCGIAEVDVVAIDSEETVEQISLESTVNPVTSTRSDNLAYVIYTSGTTGKPKGVMIEHKGVVNSSYAAIGHRSIIRNSKMLSSAPYVFDSFVLEIYPTLFAGGSLFISDEALRKDIYSIYDYCVRNRITNLFLTTKLAEEFLHLENDELCLTSLAVGGEKLRTQKIPRFHLVNEYGPTENTVCTTQFRVTGCNKDIPIGKPIANTRCYVLGKNLGLVPIGSVGELYIGGDGLARGYLNREELTREKFISNPFQTKEEKKQNKNSRIYRTGDLVRWLPDGNLEYIGRNDFQVKIRGHRIELGEIEKTLANYKGIRQSVVLAKERKVAGDTVEEDRECTKYLVGYYVSEPELEEKNILSFLENKLPWYMLPNIWVRLDNLPLTINGKLDRKALPDPKFTDKDNYVRPRNDIERKMCQIWGEALRLDESKVGIRDDFFRLGGDSIISIQLVSRIRQRLDLHINVKDIFLFKTIEKLCENVLKQGADNAENEYEKFII